MTIEMLKQMIEDKVYDGKFMIWKYADSDFIPHQYLDRLLTYIPLKPYITADFNDIPITYNNMFGIENDEINIVISPEITSLNTELVNEKNIIIICKKLIECDEIFNDYIINIPKIEPWHLKDYAYTNTEGIERSKIDWLLGIIGDNVYRLENEIDKISIFSENERKYVFEEFIDDNIFSDLTDKNIFTFTDALFKKDKDKIANMWKEIEYMDCEPLGVVTILLKQYRNLIKVLLSPNPTEENTGLTSKHIWAIKKYNSNLYTKNQIMQIFDILTEIDLKIKTGQLDTSMIIDYLIIKILTI